MRISGILAAAVVVVVLAGCGAPTPTPTASPSPSEEPAPLVRAEPVIPLTCDELVPPALVESIVGTVAVRQDGSGTVDDIAEGASRQAGTLECIWALSRDYQAFINVNVIPEPSLYTEYEGWMEVDRQYVDLDRFGDASRDYCGWGSCIAHILVGDFFVEASARPARTREDSAEGSDPRVDTVFASVVDVVRGVASNAAPAWALPEDVLRPEPGYCDDSGALVVLADALGVAELYPPGTDGFSISWWHTRERVGVQGCGIAPVSGAGSGYWYVLPGGRWAFDDLAAVGSTRLVDVEAEGVEGGRVAVAPSGSGASVTVPVEGSVVVFEWTLLAPDEIVALVPAVVEAARASAG